jgi:hypothetical protein
LNASNVVVRQIYLIEKELDKKKNGTINENFDLCRSADWTCPHKGSDTIDFQRINFLVAVDGRGSYSVDP